MLWHLAIAFACAFLGERFKVGAYFIFSALALMAYVLTAPGSLFDGLRIIMIGFAGFFFIRGFTLKHDTTEKE